MLSISKPMKGCGKGDYYLNLAKEDYYLEGGEPQGKWHGKGAGRLGLEGEISQEEFRHLLGGYAPDGKRELTQNAGDEDRRSGWDLTFSAPKSVSALWAVSDEETRHKIQELQEQAVRTSLDYLERNAGWTRRGKDGLEKERSDLIFTTFEHGTSRAQDPDLHTHVIVQNISLREDGSTGSIDSAPLYQHKMAAGALYRVELARGLERDLGLKIERDKDSFAVEGVSQELCKEWSKRRKEILRALDERGMSGAKAASIAAFETRGAKGNVPRKELFESWQRKGKELNFGKVQARGIIQEGRERTQKELVMAKAEVFGCEIEQSIKNQSYFTEREVVRFAAVESQGRGLSAEEVIKYVRQELSQSQKIVHLGISRNEERFTTQEMLNLEKTMLEQVAQSKWQEFRVSSDKVQIVVNAWKDKGEALSCEQEAALKHITKERGGVCVVSGMAGAGKSRMLSAAREVWQNEGYLVLGAALAGKAAQGLESSAGIKSETIHKILSDIENGVSILNSKTILVIDEAGMVGTRQMSKLIEAAKQTRAKLVLVGDERQLQPIDAGGPFKAIQEVIGVARLNEIKRQEDAWAREAVKDFALGNARKGLESYAEKGLLFVEDNRKQAQEKLIFDWSVQGVNSPERNLILAGSNSEVIELNQRAQAQRRDKGALGARAVERGDERFYEGDRVVFNRNSRLYGVRNGDLGTIKAIDKQGRLTVELEKGRMIRFSLEHYRHVHLGYAVTTHKAQGITVKNVYVLAGGSMQDRELTYVQMSRAKEKTHVYIDKHEAGENLKEIATAMQRSRAKELAVEIEQRQEQSRGIERKGGKHGISM